MRGVAFRCLVALVLGVLTTMAIAWTAAALRPTDGWPNALRTMADGWKESGFLPQHRQPTVWGDLYVDAIGTPVSSQVSLTPGWAVADKPDWWNTTYPLPDEVPKW